MFESYIVHKLKQTYPTWDIATQDRKHYLLNDLNLNQDKFRIRLDLVINTPDFNILGDTKWKMINQNLSGINYNISQSDIYQLFAYGKKYQSKNGHVLLVLIYPKHADFSTLLHFNYEEELNIDVIPFDFESEEDLFFHITTLMLLD